MRPLITHPGRQNHFAAPRILPAVAIVPLCAALMTSHADAAMLRHYPATLSQPDGSLLTVYLNGDEFVNGVTDARGYPLVRDPASGYIVFASSRDGGLAPTRLIAGRADPSPDSPRPGGVPALSADARARWRAREDAQRDYRLRRSHNSGAFNTLVIFIRFADEPVTGFVHAASEYDAMLNGAAGMPSMRAYFQEVSYGALTITARFFPEPETGAVASFQSDHPRAYYQPYNGMTNPVGYHDDGEGSERGRAMLKAAVAAVRPQVEASGLDVDVDDDGWVDNVIFIADGDVTGWGTVLWPHAAWLGEAPVAGANVGSYNFQLETALYSSPGAGVGQFCHEMFHSLGAPDLYHYNGDGLHPVGPWDLMEGGTALPTHMLAYMKWKYGGWLPEIPALSDSGHYTLSAAPSPDCAYRVPSPNSTSEYFIVEYRRQAGVFESALPGSGLLVYRINPAVSGNSSGPPDEVYIYRPGGTTTANGRLEEAVFSSLAGRTAINNGSNPASFLQNGAPGFLDIREIGAPGAAIGFDVRIVQLPATRLEFRVQPGPARPGQPIAPAVEVAAVSDLGAVDTAATGAVTLSLKPGTGSPGASLGGTLAAPLIAGRAIFPDVSVGQEGSGIAFTAAVPGLATGESAPFSVTRTGIVTSRVNLSGRHREAADSWADAVCVSADGRFAAFTSTANNLAPDDTNGQQDIVVRDLRTGAAVLASIATSGARANSGSGSVSLSRTGRFVVFDSWADNLVPGDGNGALDVFLRDLEAGTTERVSVGTGGIQANGNSMNGAVSADGRYVAFQSSANNLVAGDANNSDDVFLHDRVTNTTTRLSMGWNGSEANGASQRHLAISDDGGLVCFQSEANNLVPDDANGRSDIFVWSRAAGALERVSVSSGEIPGDRESWDSGMSPDGRYIVFASNAANLVAGDTNGCSDIFLRDRSEGTTVRVNLTDTGGAANNSSFFPDVSADGRYVAFESYADNLVPGDANHDMDVFLRDRQLGTTVRVNVSEGGAEATGYTQNWSMGHGLGDGPVVAFSSDAENLVAADANGRRDAFVRDVATVTTRRVSAGPDGVETGGGQSNNAMLSGDARLVVFQSTASNLVPDDTNGSSDIFVRDTLTGATERISVRDGGGQADGGSYDPAITPDGRYVAFASNAGNLVSGTGCCATKVYVHDRWTGRTRWVSDLNGSPVNGDCARPAISADGSCVAFLCWASNLVSGDTNGRPDWIWRDLKTGATKRASVSSAGEEGNDSSDVWTYPSLSADGRFVAFPSYAGNLVANDTNNASDVFVFDSDSGAVECVSMDATGRPGNSTSWFSDMSADGRFVAFMSDASNLVPNDTNGQADIFVRDRLLNITVRASLSAGGGQVTGNSRDPAISASGRFVAFKSTDGNLVPGDRNGQWDIFVTDIVTRSVVRVSEGDFGAAANGESQSRIALSADGRFVSFQSNASNLVPDDANTATDIFVRGPLWPLFTRQDVLDALRGAAGLSLLSPFDAQRLGVVAGDPARVDMADAICLARKVAGLAPNP